ncbi:MAG: mechanosensitive ion channel family protein [Pseudanabaenaceae cyanobacterium]
MLVLLLTIVPVQAQTPVDQVLDVLPVGMRRDPNVRSVTLDGRVLFTIAALAQSEEASLSLEQRVAEIEQRLQAIAGRISDPQQVVIEATVDPQSGQTVIYINQEYLMTVTTLDAQTQGLSVQAWAEQLRSILRDAFRTYHQERQPEAQWSQAGRAGLLLLLAILVSFLIERHWQKWQVHRQVLEQELQVLQQRELEEDTLEANLRKQEQTLQTRIRQWQDRQHLLRLGHIFWWVGTIVIGLGIFPYTRPWQFWLLRHLGGTVFYLFLLSLATVLLYRLSEYGIERLFTSLQQGRWFDNPRLEKRISTLSRVVTGIANIVIFLIAGLGVLSILGVSIAPIVAGLGFIGLGISLAAQDIIKDVLNGILILLEDQFAEGDIISVNGKTGQVEHMNLRITQLRNTEGTLITIPNSSIRTVENLSSGWARVDLGIDVAYDTDLDRAIAVIQETALKMSHERGWRQKIIDRPEVLGVDDFGDNSITIRLWIKVQPLKQWEVAREFRLRLKKAFDQAGISIPFPQREIWFRTSLAIADGSLALGE